MNACTEHASNPYYGTTIWIPNFRKGSQQIFLGLSKGEQNLNAVIIYSQLVSSRSLASIGVMSEMDFATFLLWKIKKIPQWLIKKYLGQQKNVFLWAQFSVVCCLDILGSVSLQIVEIPLLMRISP